MARSTRPWSRSSRAMCANPVQVVGDLYSLAACNDVGSRRLVAMMDEFEIASLDRLARISWRVAGRQPRADRPAARRHLPQRDAGRRLRQADRPVGTMTISATGIDVDYTGTSACRPTASMCRCATLRLIPRSASNASSRPSAEQCRLVVGHPGERAGGYDPQCATAGAGRDPSCHRQMLPDVVFGCLQSGARRRRAGRGHVVLVEPDRDRRPRRGRCRSGGAGRCRAIQHHELSFRRHRRATGQGRTVRNRVSSGVRNVPVEVTEAISPLLIRRKEYRVDSGGPGTNRGGLGQVMVVESRDATPFAVNANYDRIEHPARGREGGATAPRARSIWRRAASCAARVSRPCRRAIGS